MKIRYFTEASYAAFAETETYFDDCENVLAVVIHKPALKYGKVVHWYCMDATITGVKSAKTAIKRFFDAVKTASDPYVNTQYYWYDLIAESVKEGYMKESDYYVDDVDDGRIYHTYSWEVTPIDDDSYYIFLNVDMMFR